MKIQLFCLAVILLCVHTTQGDGEKVDGKQSDSGVPPVVSSTVSNHTQKTVQLPKQEAKVLTDTAPNSSVKNDSDPKATMPKNLPDVPVSVDRTDVSDSMLNATKRAVYLLSGACVVVLLYFIWKSYSLKRRQTHIHKYGVVASREDLEMTSLGFGSEDEEDDTTHFDIGKHQRS